jgi:Holliday junction resolvase-like predicted endonuclease
VDLLFWNPRVGELIVVEVRGIKKGAVGEFRPVHTLAAAKVARLERMALHWGRIYRAPVRVEFFEVIGKPPGRWCPEWFAKILFCFPRWLGLEIKQYRILG